MIPPVLEGNAVSLQTKQAEEPTCLWRGEEGHLYRPKTPIKMVLLMQWKFTSE